MPDIQKKHHHVVAAIIINRGEVLCMQRAKTRFPYTSFKYEFPGGKVEKGETSVAALRRELMEEMDYEVEIGRCFITVDHEYPDFSITMEAFLCQAPHRNFVMKEHHASQWLRVEQLDELDWAAADVPIAQRLKEEYHK